MKNLKIISKSLAVFVVTTAMLSFSSCSNNNGKITISKSEIDSLRNQIKIMTAGNETLAKNLATFDTLDYTVFSNAQ
jgi:hypothetical protein